MFHPDTQFLIDHWTRLSAGEGVRAGVPSRADFHPDVLGLRLPRAFIADRIGDGGVVRVSGGWIAAFHAQPLKDRPFSSVWVEESHALVRAAAVQAVREARPVVIVAVAGANATSLEITLVPLRGSSDQVDRVAGLYAPSGTLSFAAHDCRLLTARVSIGVGPVARAPLALAAIGGRRVA